MSVTHGNPNGSWSAANSTPQPTVSAIPITSNPPKPQKESKFTNFTYEDWTISFKEEEPFAWYISHQCTPTERSTAQNDAFRTIHYVGPYSRFVDVDDKMKEERFPGQDELETAIKCYKCKAHCPKYTYLILRRTQKMLLRGKLPLGI